jgi:hypothetical protein
MENFFVYYLTSDSVLQLKKSHKNLESNLDISIGTPCMCLWIVGRRILVIWSKIWRHCEGDSDSSVLQLMHAQLHAQCEICLLAIVAVPKARTCCTVMIPTSGTMGPRIFLLLACLFSFGRETLQSRVLILDGDACSSGNIPITFLKCYLRDVASCITGAPRCTVLTVLQGW